MTNFCPRCGAAFQVEILGEYIRANVRCPDCRLAITEVPAMLEPSDDDVGYELDDWPVPDRGAVSAALDEAEVPYRWEEGLVLVVPGYVEEWVDKVLDHIQAEAAASPSPDAALEAEGDLEDDGGEEAQAAMGDVFVAADRLQHEPWDKGAADELAAATSVIEASPPPFGIEQRMWRQIADMAGSINAQLQSPEADPAPDAIAMAARELRDFLRDYV